MTSKRESKASLNSKNSESDALTTTPLRRIKDLQSYSKSKLELNSKKSRNFSDAKLSVCVCIFLFCTKSQTSGAQV